MSEVAVLGLVCLSLMVVLSQDTWIFQAPGSKLGRCCPTERHLWAACWLQCWETRRRLLANLSQKCHTDGPWCIWQHWVILICPRRIEVWRYSAIINIWRIVRLLMFMTASIFSGLNRRIVPVCYSWLTHAIYNTSRNYAFASSQCLFCYAGEGWRFQRAWTLMSSMRTQIGDNWRA